MGVWLFIAAIKALAGVAAWLVLLLVPAPPRPGALPAEIFLLLLAVFVCSGFALIAGAGRDGPPRTLGTVFVLFGGIFADALIAFAAPQTGFSRVLRLLIAVQPVAVSSAFFWRFAWDFPRPQPALIRPRVARAIREITMYTGVGMFLLVFADGAGRATGLLPSGWSPVSLRDVLWVTLVLLTMPTVVLLLVKLQTALPEERRRLRLFIGGIVLGLAPLILDVLAGAFIPAFREYVKQPVNRLFVGQVIAGAILLLPAATAYAVVVDRVLETRFIVRMAIQYALARYTVFVLFAIPAVVLVAYLYRQRHTPLAEILVSASPAAWASLVAAVALLGWLRVPLLRSIDRRFFREQHDARDILVSLTDSTRRATSLEQMVSLVITEIDRALHVEHVAVLVRRHETFVDPANALSSLGAGTALATLAGGATTPLDVDMSDASSPLARLPEHEREWLASVRSRLIVPLLGATGSLIGLVTLGEKRSEAPYSAEDRALLKVVGAAAATALEQQLRHSSAGADSSRNHARFVRGGADEPARQCLRCDRVLESSAEACSSCGGPLSAAAVPKLLCDKFAVERRLGSGGMGVVYLAIDRSLGRPVAVKTLHRLSPNEARRLRREARALATLQHEHLELIYAVESWRGSPVLVLEYLAGGTLASRLGGGPMPVAEAAQLGAVMAEALHSLHRVGVLHCDVKPSNVGFTAKGTPKLLDFGLATAAAPGRVPMSSRPERSPASATTETESSARLITQTRGGGPAGTLIYMSPEAIDGAIPDVGFDLWSLALTVYEAIAGRHPFVARDRLDTVRLIHAANPPDLLNVRSDCPPPIAAFLANALSRDIHRRPGTAREFAAGLREALATVRSPDQAVRRR